MTGRNTPSPDSVLHILREADVEENAELLRAVEDIASIGDGPAPDASAELAQLMADGGRASRSRRTKGRITFIGGALAVSMGVGMSGVAAETIHLQAGFDGAVDSITGFALRDGSVTADGLPVPAVGAPPAQPRVKPSDEEASATAPPAVAEEPAEVPAAPAPGVTTPEAPPAATSSAGSAPAPTAPTPGAPSSPDLPASGTGAPVEPRDDSTPSTDPSEPRRDSTVQASGGIAGWLRHTDGHEFIQFGSSTPDTMWLSEPGVDPGVVALLSAPETVEGEWLALFLAEIIEIPVDGPIVDLPPVDPEAPGGFSPDTELSDGVPTDPGQPKDAVPDAEGASAESGQPLDVPTELQPSPEKSAAPEDVSPKEALPTPVAG